MPACGRTAGGPEVFCCGGAAAAVFLFWLPRATVGVVPCRVTLVESRSVVISRVVRLGVSRIRLRRAWRADRRTGFLLCRCGRRGSGLQDFLHLPVQCLLMPAVSLHEFLRSGGNAHCFLHVFWGRNVHPFTVFWQQCGRTAPQVLYLS